MDEAALQREAARLGVVIGQAQAWELLFHLDAVLRANEQMNLTAIVDRDEAIRLHILDSLTAVEAVSAAPDGPLADIGSGAGYPGIPLAIVLDRETTLVESRSRKAAFLSAVSKGLDHEIDIAAVRAEELAIDRTGRYAVVTARAVAKLASLVELAAPLLAPGGRLIAMKGEPGATELSDGETVAAKVGLTQVEILRPTIPDVVAQRTLVVYELTHDPVADLPRRPGMAQKHPLS